MQIKEDKEYLSDLNEAQKAPVIQKDGPLIVVAGAGSGKTRVLTYRIVHLLKNQVPPFNILALTFTNKASKEMQNRFKKLFKKHLNRKLGGKEYVDGEGEVRIVFSKIVGESHSSISAMVSHTAMSCMTLVMREYGYDAYSESKENDSVYDVEVRGLKDGERYKGSKEGYGSSL